MTVEEQRKYFLEKYGIDIDKVEKVVIPEEEWEGRQPFYEFNDGGNATPFSPQPHNPIRTSGKKPRSQKENPNLD